MSANRLLRAELDKGWWAARDRVGDSVPQALRGASSAVVNSTCVCSPDNACAEGGEVERLGLFAADVFTARLGCAAKGCGGEGLASCAWSGDGG